MFCFDRTKPPVRYNYKPHSLRDKVIFQSTKTGKIYVSSVTVKTHIHKILNHVRKRICVCVFSFRAFILCTTYRCQYILYYFFRNRLTFSMIIVHSSNQIVFLVMNNIFFLSYSFLFHGKICVFRFDAIRYLIRSLMIERTNFSSVSFFPFLRFV